MRLRRFTPDDADLLFALHNDPEVMRYINGGAPVSRSEIIEQTLPSFMSYYERFEHYGFWVAVESASARDLGWFHFRPRVGDASLQPELGYRLHQFGWNRGYATEGSRALVDKGFAEFGVERVTAETMAVNIGSRRVMEKVGLRLVRTFHLDWLAHIPGAEHGEVEYMLDRATWQSGLAL
jgi:RimJ/RimL family protein N-acetyltransferase